MGTGGLQTIQQFFPSRDLPIFKPLTHGVARGPSFSGKPPKPDGAPALAGLLRGKGQGEARGLEKKLAEEFEAVVYSSQMERIALSARFFSLTGQAASDGDGEAEAVQVGVQQLSFDFFAESRTEELALFRQRTGAVADGLEGAQQETFIEASQRVAARFSLSVEVSGVVLSGFAGGAEKLQDEDAALDGLLALADEALAQADEVLNQIFEMLQGFFSGEGDFAGRFQQLVEDLLALNTATLPAGTAPAAASASGGTAQAYQLNIQLEFQFEFSATVQFTQQGVVQESDPVTLDLDGDGIELTSFRDGARFDIAGAGQQAATAFVTGGDAFLALDRNGNGRIDSGAELFGDQHGAANGFEELRKLDTNRDGLINARDVSFDALLLFKDNGNGVAEPGELLTLAQAGIAELSLNYRHVDERAAGGNRIAQIATYRRADGTTGVSADAVLNFLA